MKRSLREATIGIMNPIEYDEVAVNFERVLKGLLQQNYNVTSDVYFDMFIKHLSSKNADGIGESATSGYYCT